MADEIIIDGLEEHAFRRSIESMLRHGRADEAAERLKSLLPDLAGPILPARLLEITSADLTFKGWDQIAAKLNEYGRGETPITAVGIGICDPQDTGIHPDEDGNLRPPLETTYYSDATFPFSQTDREDLLEGYSSYGCEWQGDHDRADYTLAIDGIDDIYGAIAALESKVAESERPSAQDIRAGAVGACYLGVLVFQAARDAAIRHGLPRPLAILLVNSDAYPFFDAPVLTCDEYLDDGVMRIVERVPAGALSGSAIEADGYEPEQTGSLIGMGMSGVKAGARKKMALALEGDEAANPLGMADELVAEAAFNPGAFDLSRFMPQAPEPHEEHTDTDAAHWPDRDPLTETDSPPEIEYPVETADSESGLHGSDEDYYDAEAPANPATPENTSDGMPPQPEQSHTDTLELIQPAGHSLRSRIRIAPIEEEVPSALDKVQAAIARFFKRVQDMLLRR